MFQVLLVLLWFSYVCYCFFCYCLFHCKGVFLCIFWMPRKVRNFQLLPLWCVVLHLSLALSAYLLMMLFKKFGSVMSHIRFSVWLSRKLSCLFSFFILIVYITDGFGQSSISKNAMDFFSHQTWLSLTSWIFCPKQGNKFDFKMVLFIFENHIN